MGLETGTFIDSLNSSNPAAGDPVNEGDDHIRLVKSTVKATFPNYLGFPTFHPAKLPYNTRHFKHTFKVKPK